jgi:hypothetical protein
MRHDEILPIFAFHTFTTLLDESRQTTMGMAQSAAFSRATEYPPNIPDKTWYVG